MSKRQLFLALSAAVAVAVMIVAHEVMLPFVLAAVIAYVLWPLVKLVERRRVPRFAAILLVYAAVLGSIALFVRAASPRTAHELASLRGELPAPAQEAREKWVPALPERLRAVGLGPAQPPPSETAEPAPTSAFVARPQPDGSIAI